MTATHLSHYEHNSSYGLTLGDLSAVIAHTGQDRQRQVEIRWQCTTLNMSRESAVDLWTRIGAALGVLDEAVAS